MMSDKIVNGRASICDWEVWFEFKEHKQFFDFFTALFEAKAKGELSFTEITFEPDYEYTTHDLSRASVKGCWAGNLTKISELLEKVDFDPEQDKEKIC
jgi:hypothetical protein